MDRYDAFVRLLQRPDLPCLPPRRHQVTREGDPARRQTVLLPLLTRWAQRRCLAVDPDPVLAPAHRGLSPCRRVVGFDQERRRQRARGPH